jgi:hypothetical protein
MFPSGIPVVSDVDRETFGAQAAGHEVGYFFFVFDKEAAHRDFSETCRMES